MAVNLLSANLNIWGNAGAFETDPSTWGFNGNDYGNASVRSSELAKNGLYSNKVTPAGSFGILDSRLLCAGKYTGVVGHTYLARVWVRTPTASPVASDDCFFSFENTIVPFLTAETVKTVVDAKDTWVQVEAKWVHSLLTNEIYLSILQSDPGDTLSTGPVYIDTLEIYEYEEVVDACDLLIDTPGTVIANESAPAAGDGSITVAVTGGDGTLEYSKDAGGSWQLSNVFAGLTTGIYPVKVREVATPSCVSSQSFAVNASSYLFSFTTDVTDETISGAEDGVIEVTVTGDTAPFTYSSDGGATYQAGNIFTDLPAGDYIIVVKDADDIIRSATVTISAGEVLFEKVWLSRNPITKGMTASSGWDALNNFRLYDDIRVEEEADSGTYVSQLKIHLVPFTDGSVTFQTREAFRKILTATPPNASTTIERLTDRIKLFKHYTGEVDGVDETPGALTGSLPNVVMMGGLSKYKFAEIDFFGDYVPTNKNFMTWAPTTKPVDRNQDDYLNYFVFDAATVTLKLEIVAYYDDDTTETDVVLTQTGVQYGQLYQIPAGPNNSGALLINPAKTLTKYDLSILDQDDSLISEVRTYVLDAFTHPRKRLFMFLNSLGAYEILRFTGMADTSVDVSKEEIVKFLPVTYEQADGEREVNNATMRTGGSYGSGLFNNENASAWLDYMKDFLLSKRVFLIDGSNLIPVVVSGGNFAMNADQVYEKAIRFTAVNSYQEENYTPEDI